VGDPTLSATHAAVTAVYASAEALDRLAPAGAVACRIAPDEAMFVAAPQDADRVVRDAGAVTAGDPDAVVLDATDGWAVWTLVGEAAHDAFARLSRLELPVTGFMQGEAAHVAVRVISSSGRIDILVPAMWRDYLRERILARCADLGIGEGVPGAWGG
jgi:glucokinase